jgi:hypothetical protein
MPARYRARAPRAGFERGEPAGRRGRSRPARLVGAGRPAGRVSLRWIYVHMIEETARHVGHADILREQTDGATGVDG